VASALLIAAGGQKLVQMFLAGEAQLERRVATSGWLSVRCTRFDVLDCCSSQRCQFPKLVVLRDSAIATGKDANASGHTEVCLRLFVEMNPLQTGADSEPHGQQHTKESKAGAEQQVINIQLRVLPFDIVYSRGCMEQIVALGAALSDTREARTAAAAALETVWIYEEAVSAQSTCLFVFY
jgi:hypothetical protein